MSEIKFRAWDYGEMKYSKDFIGLGSFFQFVNDRKLALMQFTGIHDRNGQEIYEGDVVHWHVNDVDRTAPVYYDEQCACFWMGKDIASGFLVINDWLRGEYEVIGNIHKNPDLLKANK